MKFIELDFVEKPKNFYNPNFMKNKPTDIAIKIPTTMKRIKTIDNIKIEEEVKIGISFLMNYLKEVEKCLRINGYTTAYIENNIIYVNNIKDPNKPYWSQYYL